MFMIITTPLIQQYQQWYSSTIYKVALLKRMMQDMLFGFSEKGVMLKTFSCLAFTCHALLYMLLNSDSKQLF